MSTRLSAMLLLCSAVITVACSKESPVSPSSPAASASAPQQPAYSVTSFVSGVNGADSSTGVLRSGPAPQPSGGPSVQPTANNGVINGGASQVRLRSTVVFQTVYVFIGGVNGSVGGYWELRLSSPTSDATVIITQARSIPAGRFDSVFAVASPSGAIGAYSAVQTQVLAAATGDVQVSVSWDAASDVDLHVIDPRGEEIFYGRSTSASGGQLDLDSNASCSIDNKNNENVRWPSGRAPNGTYTVRLDYWSSCGVPSTNYVVTVNNGGATQTFRGMLTGAGDQGSSGSGRTITTFTRAGSSITAAALGELGLSPQLIPLSPSALSKLRAATGGR